MRCQKYMAFAVHCRNSPFQSLRCPDFWENGMRSWALTNWIWFFSGKAFRDLLDELALAGVL